MQTHSYGTQGHIGTKRLSDFVTTKSRQSFVAFDIPRDFLHQHPSEWKSNSGYIRGLCRVQAVKAVNDAAEHGFSLIQSLNAAITNQEEQKQFLLQVVEKHRLDFPDLEKSTLDKFLLTINCPKTVKRLNF